MRNRPGVVLDTNVLLVSISSKSKYHWIFSKLLSGVYELYITNEILLEYEEIISSRYNQEVAGDVIRMLLFLENVVLVTPFFKWDLITGDSDDYNTPTNKTTQKMLKYKNTKGRGKR